MGERIMAPLRYLDAMASKAANGYTTFCRQDFVRRPSLDVVSLHNNCQVLVVLSYVGELCVFDVALPIFISPVHLTVDVFRYRRLVLTMG